MKNAPKTTIAAMMALALCAAPLAACGGQVSQDTTGGAASQAQAAGVDVSGWKTLGDALAYDSGENNAASWDEQHYLTVFTTADGSVVRVVAKMDAKTYDEHAALDMSEDDYQQKFLEVMGGLPLESAEDLTDDVLSQEELDAYVGKTGQDLAADGFVFESYFMYGGEQTIATMAKGYLAYSVTFDKSVSEDEADSDEDGSAVMDAPVASVEFAGGSDAALDPTAV